MKASYLPCEEGHSVQTGVQWSEAHWNQNHSSSKDILTWGTTLSLTEKAGEKEKQLMIIDVKRVHIFVRLYFLYWVPHIRWDTFSRGQSWHKKLLNHRVENWLNQEERWTNKPIKGIMDRPKDTWHANWFQGKHNLLCNALPRRTSDYWRPKVRDTWLANRGKWQI